MTDPRSTDPRSGPVGTSPRAPNQSRSPQQHQLDGRRAHRIGRAGRRGVEICAITTKATAVNPAPVPQTTGQSNQAPARLARDHSLSRCEARVPHLLRRETSND